jgi:GTP:adenosylcobinamide-phosphate guanylyltransferase
MTVPDSQVTLVVLAAQRDGILDPLARDAGVTHKCLVPIGGKPLLAHVLAALVGIEFVSGVKIVVEPGAAELLRPLADASGLQASFVSAADNIADSVYRAAAEAAGPVVITTADNVLLTGDAIRRVAAPLRDGADAVVALATKASVLAAHPEGQRRFYRFRDDSYSNCNLYALSERGLRLAETFREGGQFASKPRRIARAVGLLNLVVMRFALVSLDGAMRRLGRRFRVTAAAVVLPDGAHAVDVDNDRTYRVAEQLLRRRARKKQRRSS